MKVVYIITMNSDIVIHILDVYDWNKIFDYME